MWVLVKSFHKLDYIKSIKCCEVNLEKYCIWCVLYFATLSRLSVDEKKWVNGRDYMLFVELKLFMMSTCYIGGTRNEQSRRNRITWVREGFSKIFGRGRKNQNWEKVLRDINNFLKRFSEILFWLLINYTPQIVLIQRRDLGKLKI